MEEDELPWEIVMKNSSDIASKLQEFHCGVREITTPNGQIAINVVDNNQVFAQLNIDETTTIGVLRSVLGKSTCHGINIPLFTDDDNDIIPTYIELDDEKTVKDYPECLVCGRIFCIY